VNKKIVVKRITVGLNKQESKLLDHYCEMTGRGYTDVLRECIRNLPLSNHFIDIPKYPKVDQ